MQARELQKQRPLEELEGLEGHERRYSNGRRVLSGRQRTGHAGALGSR